MSVERPGIEKLQAIVDEISSVDDRDLRAEMLIELAEKFVPVPERIATRPYPDSHRAPACESEAYAWLEAQGENAVKLHFAVENPQGISARALASVLDEGLSGAPKTELANVPERLVEDLFGNSISMGKGQGLRGIIRVVKFLATRP